MPYLTVNNKTVHIQELNARAKETVVLIHGMFSNLGVYYYQIAPILADKYHVIMYDLKSHGLSEKNTLGYSLEEMAEELNMLLQTMGLSTVHLAGYSFGGLIALKFAMRFPASVRKLAVIEAPDPSDDEARRIMDDYSKALLETYVLDNSLKIKKTMGKRQLEKNHRMYEYLFNNTSIKKDLLAEKNFFTNSGLENINTNTLLIYGNHSNCMAAGKDLEAKIKSSKIQCLQGDHNLPVHQPILLANTLQAFFSS